MNLFATEPSDSRGDSFSDSGQLVYTLTFTDGSSGIFTSIVPIPEPGTIAVVAAGAVGAVGAWMRRRKRRAA